ncbi:MAG TPA: SOS response-associated peptidase [Casimicrobiaceae bacterium]|jgi:putative SOS response-associated peptidase YedK
MCGRYELHTDPGVIALAFGLAHAPEIAPRYNIAPTQQIPIVRVNAVGERELVQLRWGLVPRWAKDPSIGARMINVRAETVEARLRYAFRRHRCLVPADGFYEWRRVATGKQPMLVARTDGEPFGMAGVYERWLSPDGEVLDTCTIVTTQANGLLRPVHDRMPVIVPPEQYARWLDASEEDVTDLLAPPTDRLLRIQPVSTRVNSVQNDDASLIAPVEEAMAPADASQAEEPELPLQPRLL